MESLAVCVQASWARPSSCEGSHSTPSLQQCKCSHAFNVPVQRSPFETQGLRLLPGAFHVLEAGQNSSVLERKGKQVFTINHIVCTDSLSKLTQNVHPYHIGNISKSSFSNASQRPASLFTESSLRPVVLTLSAQVTSPGMFKILNTSLLKINTLFNY